MREKTAGRARGFIERRSPISVLLCWQFLARHLPIILPHSLSRHYWDMAILALVTYNAVAVPFEVGFEVTKPAALTTFESYVDLCFFLDILMNFRTAYVDDHGNMVRDEKKIARRYLRTWFPIDFCATVPVDTIANLLGANSGSSLTLLAFLKTPRLLRLGRLLRFLDRLKNANYFKMVQLMVLMCLIAHWIACTWQMAYRFTKGRYPWTIDKVAGLDVFTQFMAGFYKSFILMVGDNVQPENNLERALCCVVLVLGAGFYATVVGNMALLVNSMNATSARHKLKQEMVQDALRYLGVPPPIQQRIHDYFDYLGTYAHPGTDGMAFLKELPCSIFEDVAVWLYQDMLQGIPLFRHCDVEFITRLATSLRVEVYMPGETVFRYGDVGDEMYIVMKGHVAVLSQYAELLSILTRGNYFGDLALLSTTRRTASCVCLSHSDITVVGSSELQMAMKAFPDSALRVQEEAARRLHEIQMRETNPEVESRCRTTSDEHNVALGLHQDGREQPGGLRRSLSINGTRGDYGFHRSVPMAGDGPAKARKQADSSAAGEFVGTGRETGGMPFQARRMTTVSGSVMPHSLLVTALGPRVPMPRTASSTTDTGSVSLEEAGPQGAGALDVGALNSRLASMEGLLVSIWGKVGAIEKRLARTERALEQIEEASLPSILPSSSTFGRSRKSVAWVGE
ncbi:unnamed protein product [Ostreobium quekettii]|uniref:Cyclic nucleotide-binding domain-containing protein n=1 Tax=Ostreobium quekettii TaxID=121088 RepID=A0A8S1IZV2_9CHLO|nr:unnamed protein product [Ostreobium quekettii]